MVQCYNLQSENAFRLTNNLIDQVLGNKNNGKYGRVVEARSQIMGKGEKWMFSSGHHAAFLYYFAAGAGWRQVPENANFERGVRKETVVQVLICFDESEARDLSPARPNP